MVTRILYAIWIQIIALCCETSFSCQFRGCPCTPVDSSLSTLLLFYQPSSFCLSAITSFWSSHYVSESHKGVPHSVMLFWRGTAGVYTYLYLLRITPCLVSELRTTDSGWCLSVTSLWTLSLFQFASQLSEFQSLDTSFSKVMLLAGVLTSFSMFCHWNWQNHSSQMLHKCS